ncbi:uncharacterized protein LOC133895159 [Phragmites australis]|uniref:uncharacterized protein LOC133895159 n=1 Tax=Phragmites australis TaxID=29695 RepID=UPI002D7865DC|nr:uncharacterized protein LOC133895159 [Phragmites australis]
MANQTCLLETIAQAENNNRGYGPQNKMAEFVRIKPPTFDSTEDPLEANDWLRDITRKLKVINCEGQERVNLATHQLTGSTTEWWENYCEASVDADAITWEEFCEEFRKHHVLEGTMEMKPDEFCSLKQGSMIVNQYIRKFIRLSRYALEDVSTNKKKQDCFKKGLQSSLYIQLVSVVYPDFNTLMNRTILLEEACAPIEEERKRKFSDQGQQGIMSFGLTNALAYFMNLMTKVFMEELYRFVIVFIDDILIYSRSAKKHEQHLRVVMERLRAHQLYAKFSKCEFWFQEVIFIAHVLMAEVVSVDPSKVEVVVEWIQPVNISEIRIFLGLEGYYRKFIEGFSKLAKTMTKLLQNDAKFEWDEAREKTFQELKKRLTTALVLKLPNIQKDFVVYRDASRQGLGCVLMQQGKVVAYASR